MPVSHRDIKRTFIAYIDALIGWGDQLFRRDTGGSGENASALYVLATKLLGPRALGSSGPVSPARTFRSLAASQARRVRQRLRRLR